MLQNGYWRSVAVQVFSEPGNCHGTGLILRTGAGVRMQILAGSVLGAGFAKTMTSNLPIALSMLCFGGSFIVFLLLYL